MIGRMEPPERPRPAVETAESGVPGDPPAPPPPGVATSPPPMPPPPASLPEPRPRHATGAFFAALLLMMVLPLVAMVLPGPWRATGGLLAVQLAALLAVALTVVVSRVPSRRLLALELPPPAAWAGAALLGAGVVLFALSTLVRLYTLFGEELYGELIEALLADVERAVGRAGLMLLIAGVAPLCEELLFRGAVLRGLLVWGRWPAVVLSAALFGVYHLHPVHGLVAFVLGLACGAAAVLSGSIWPAVAIHVINNAVVGAYGLGGDDPGALPLWLAAPALALAAAGLALLGRARVPGGTGGGHQPEDSPTSP